MKKEWITLIMISVLTIIITVLVHAETYTFNGFVKGKSGGDIGIHKSVSSFISYYENKYDMSFDKVNYAGYFYKGNQYGHPSILFVIPSDAIFYYIGSDSYGKMYKAIRLNSDGSIDDSFPFYELRYTLQDEYLSIYDCDLSSDLMGVKNFNDTSTYEFVMNAPCAASYEAAIAYLETGDFSYLENAEDYIEVPVPKNLSVYLASEENILYLYYENEVSPLSLSTRIYTEYCYNTASDECFLVSANTENFDYLIRNQYAIDLTELESYDSGFVKGSVRNYYTIDYDNMIFGNEVFFCYYPESKQCNVIIYDKNNEIISDRIYDVNDYRNKNDSYTGGQNISLKNEVSEISTYNFFDYMASGFGLLGPSGLIAMFTLMFSMFPPEVFMLITTGVSAIIGLAVWHMFVKS